MAWNIWFLLHCGSIFSISNIVLKDGNRLKQCELSLLTDVTFSLLIIFYSSCYFQFSMKLYLYCKGPQSKICHFLRQGATVCAADPAAEPRADRAAEEPHPEPFVQRQRRGALMICSGTFNPKTQLITYKILCISIINMHYLNFSLLFLFFFSKGRATMWSDNNLYTHF